MRLPQVPASRASLIPSQKASEFAKNAIRLSRMSFCCICENLIPICKYRRKELLYEARTATAFTRLYDASPLIRFHASLSSSVHFQLLIRIEGDIEAQLANLETLLPNAHADPTNPELLLLRKQLTGLFADYDAVAKRIRALPCPPPADAKNGDSTASISAQERVQQAVWTRALTFMQMHIGLLQARIMFIYLPS